MARKKPTKKQIKERLEMARKYESAWHYLFAQLAQYKQDAIIDDPQGHIASDFAHEVAKFAETKDCPEMPVI